MCAFKLFKTVFNVRYLAIDETDRMGEKGHFEELQKLLEKLREESEEGVGNSWQTFVMSATLSLVHKAPTYNKGTNNYPHCEMNLIIGLGSGHDLSLTL